jgi:hypothetical protein
MDGAPRVFRAVRFLTHTIRSGSHRHFIDLAHWTVSEIDVVALAPFGLEPVTDTV